MTIPVTVLSDIHFLHNQNKTHNIIKNLNLWLIKHADKIITSKIFFITGDVFHKLSNINSKETASVYNFLTKLVLLCKDHNIKLRILEGTPSHDWKQVRVLYEIIDSLNIKVDFKYFDTVEIEYMHDLDINVLYVPDEIQPTSELIYKDVLNKFKEHNLKKVDIAAMHGAFTYQLPEFVDDLLNEDDYLKLVEGFIIIGHIHARGTYKRIITPGSFDRLDHSDGRHEKGGVFIKYDNITKKFKANYLNNHNAVKFKTFTLKDDLDITKAKQALKDEPLNENIFVRFVTNNNTKELNTALTEFKKEHPNLTLTFINKLPKPKESVKIKTSNIKITKLNRTTITDYVKEAVTDIDHSLAELVLKELDFLFDH